MKAWTMIHGYILLVRNWKAIKCALCQIMPVVRQCSQCESYPFKYLFSYSRYV